MLRLDRVVRRCLDTLPHRPAGKKKTTALFTKGPPEQITSFPSARKSLRSGQHPNSKKTMGDRSPKANQKKSSQKQSKTAGANQQKQNATAAKQAAKVAPKKK